VRSSHTQSKLMSHTCKCCGPKGMAVLAHTSATAAHLGDLPLQMLHTRQGTNRCSSAAAAAAAAVAAAWLGTAGQLGGLQMQRQLLLLC
jgi:hypothetical protein